MFWQIILFIVITFGIGFLKALKKAESESAVLVFIAVLIGFLGSLFYTPWAIIWSLNFLIGFNGLGYWTVMGLLILIKMVFVKIDSD